MTTSAWFARIPRFPIHSLWLAWVLALYFTFFLNAALWGELKKAQGAVGDGASQYAVAWMVGVTGVHFCLLSWVLIGRFARWSAGALILMSASAAVFSGRYGVHYDKTMLRNIFHTHYSEASELFSLKLAGDVLLLATPALLLLLVRVKRESWRAYVQTRLIFSLLVGLMALGLGVLFYKDLSSQMRNHPEIRYSVIPASILASSIRIASESNHPKELIPIGLDAHVKTGPAQQMPILVVLVVGETARAANWALSGYARDTNPGLRQHKVLNFPYATTCGTNTEVSVPCMFSRQGRHDYNESQIRTTESVLHLLSRAGVSVTWIDNQSGCKGVCKDLRTLEPVMFQASAFCKEGACLDEVLVEQLKREIFPQPKQQLIVLHQLGSHGPAYSARYPASRARFVPDCRQTDLDKCTDQELVNAYDNTVAYTDHVLSKMIDVLKTVKDRQVAFVYLSDHGESLGEHGMYLHGLPYTIAPQEQTQVPFLMWFSDRYYEKSGTSQDCLSRLSRHPAHHDNLFDTLIGLMGVSATEYNPDLDLLDGCRG
jgi:lipid A ethanolaminephosphotransferase